MHRHRIRAVAVAIALACLAIAAPARADELPRVGVVVALPVNVEPGRADQLADAMGAALARELLVDVIAGSEARRRLPPEGLPEECVAQPDCLAEVGRRLQADQLLMLVIVKVGDQLQVDTTWVDVATGKTASRPAIEIAADEASANEIFAANATRLLPAARIRPKATTTTTIQLGGGPRTRIELVQEPRRMTRGAWIASGVGAAALVGGVGFGLAARSRYNDLEQACGGACIEGVHPEYAELDSIGTRALAADLLLGTALVAGVTAAILYWNSGAERQVETPVRVSASSGGLGLAIGGRF